MDPDAYRLRLEDAALSLLDAMGRQYGQPFSFNVNAARERLAALLHDRRDRRDEAPPGDDAPR